MLYGKEAYEGATEGAHMEGDAAAPTSPRATLDRIVTVACRLGEAREARVLLRDRDDGDSLVVVAGCCTAQRELGLRVPAGEGVAGRVVTSGAATIDAEVNGGGARRLKAAAPLVWGGEVHGALVATARARGRRFGPSDLELVSDLALLASDALEHAEMRARLEAAVAAGVGALAAAVDMRDDYTARHSEDVVDLARRVAHALALDPTDRLELEFAARLHDVGKIGVPDSILTKPGPLDEREWDVMRRHPVWGAQMLERVPGLERVARFVRYHHERFDGRGYPEGLRAERIPLASRVICVCDAFQAMIADRPYRAGLDRDRALDELAAGAGEQFDPEIVAIVLDTAGS